MPETPCPRCGAPGKGFVCAYCGAELAPAGDDRSELAALDEYHAHLKAAGVKSDQCARLITEGFIPTGKKALIEAGLRCLPHLDLDQPIDGCHDQWVKRLEAIETRLRVSHRDDDSRHAADQFAAKIQAFRERSESDMWKGFGCLAILAFIAAGGLWWAYRLIRP